MTPIAQALAVAGLAIGTGAATVSMFNGDIPDLDVPAHAWADTGALDGRSFDIVATLDNGAEEETDTLVFRYGGFLSVDCERYCNFGFSDYRTWTDGGTIHFTTTAQCSTAPHTTVWYGQVVDDTITVEMTWTTRRWYWTHQIRGTGTGARVEQTEDIAG